LSDEQLWRKRGKKKTGQIYERLDYLNTSTKRSSVKISGTPKKVNTQGEGMLEKRTKRARGKGKQKRVPRRET